MLRSGNVYLSIESAATIRRTTPTNLGMSQPFKAIKSEAKNIYTNPVGDETVIDGWDMWVSIV